MPQNPQPVVGPRIVRPHPGTNRHERRRAQALAVAAERRKARAAVVASRKSGKGG